MRRYDERSFNIKIRNKKPDYKLLTYFNNYDIDDFVFKEDPLGLHLHTQPYKDDYNILSVIEHQIRKCLKDNNFENVKRKYNKYVYQLKKDQNNIYYKIK